MADGRKFQVSLDGGKTWQEAPEGIRLMVDQVPIPGEDEDGEIHFNFTHEGLITDVWHTKLDQHSGQPASENPGTSCSLYDDLVADLCAENS